MAGAEGIEGDDAEEKGGKTRFDELLSATSYCCSPQKIG
jgi:hypothetical protein